MFSIETKIEEQNGEEKSSKSTPIRTGYSNLLHGCDFFYMTKFTNFLQKAFCVKKKKTRLLNRRRERLFQDRPC